MHLGIRVTVLYTYISDYLRNKQRTTLAKMFADHPLKVGVQLGMCESGNIELLDHPSTECRRSTAIQQPSYDPR